MTDNEKNNNDYEVQTIVWPPDSQVCIYNDLISTCIYKAQYVILCTYFKLSIC